jgi:hypothetical protein
MNPDLFSKIYSRDDQSEYSPYHSALSKNDEPVGTITLKSDTINVNCQISQTQMEQLVVDFVRVFGIKAVLNAATSHIN